MRLNVLYIPENRIAVPGVRRPAAFSSANITGTYFPARGVPLSLIFHAILAVGYIFLPPLPKPLQPLPPPEQIVMIDLNDPDALMYLPELGGGSQGMDLLEKKAEDSIKASSLSAAGGSKGLSYPGPQRIVSDPPEPTNEIQTILQPEIDNPTILTPLIPLPNIVQIAAASPVAETSSSNATEPLQEPQPIEPQPEEPKPVEPPRDLAPPEEEANLVIPTLPPLEIEQSLPLEEPPMVVPLIPPPPEPIPEPKSEEQAAKPVEKPKIEAKPAIIEENKNTSEMELPDLPTGGTNSRTLLALTPMPAQLEQNFDVPLGEARGRFAISPEPNPDTEYIKSGSKLETSEATSTVGTSTSAIPGNEAPGDATVVTLAPIATNSGGNKDDNSPSIGATTRTASGSGTGTGVGSGKGTGSGSGSGAGAGPGKGAFSGITIIGGAKSSRASTTSSGSSSGSSIKILKSAPKPVRSSYGMTVISTENSGGGLPSFGVFGQERIYTVFLDMRETETDSIPKWTLEFAVIREEQAQDGTESNSSKNQQGLVLPYPMHKVQPTLPAELVRKYSKQSIIVYAIINVGGTMEQITVKDSPDPLLNEPVISALSQWAFRSATLSGESVAVKVLLGIPLWMPE